MKFVKCFLIAILAISFSGCGANQQLENARGIAAGMSKQNVRSVMGDDPVATEFYGKLEEWHFCNTGMNGVSRYVAVFFDEGKVFAMKPYSVVEKEAGGSSFAVCEEFIKKGDYREPDIVREYRVRVN